MHEIAELIRSLQRVLREPVGVMLLCGERFLTLDDGDGSDRHSRKEGTTGLAVGHSQTYVTRER
ncbi:hypothetical protein DSECCO2_268060 [anaerobic digester metagenome]